MKTPGESHEYRVARDHLLDKERELRRAMEDLAVARRALPPGGEIPEDYVFECAAAGEPVQYVKFSELFARGKDSLIVYNFMFPRHPQDDRAGMASGVLAQLPIAQGPCPSCVAVLDQLDGAAEHLEQNANLAVVAKASTEQLAAIRKERGWRHLRLLSSAKNTFKRDYHAETAEGFSMPMLSVFHRDGNRIRHFWSSELLYAPAEPDQDPRHIGTLEPLWNLFDFTREGRPRWDEQLQYGHCCAKDDER